MVANLIVMIGVNVAGILVYDRRDQVHRKLFAVIRACSTASLRIQDERAKLVFSLGVYLLYIVHASWRVSWLKQRSKPN